MQYLHRCLLLAHSAHIGLLDSCVDHVHKNLVPAVVALEMGSLHLGVDFRYPHNDGPDHNKPADVLGSQLPDRSPLILVQSLDASEEVALPELFDRSAPGISFRFDKIPLV